MGAGLRRAFAATAMTRLTERQRNVLSVIGDDWMDADGIAKAAGIVGYSPREIAAKVANALTRDFILEKGGRGRLRHGDVHDAKDSARTGWNAVLDRIIL